MQPPEGPPVWTALKSRCPPRMPPPMSIDDLAQGGAHGHFHQARCCSPRPPGRRPWCPCCLSVPMAGEPLGPRVDDFRDVGPGLHVVDDRGLAPEAVLGREGRPGPRLADVALHGGDERRLFAADKGPGPLADLEVEVEAGAQDVVPQEAACPGPGRWRVSGASPPGDIRGAHRCSPGWRRWRRPPMIMPSRTAWGSPSMTARSMKAPGSPSSPLQMMNFDLARGTSRQRRHLRPVGKPPPPRPLKPGALHLVDDLLRGHGEQHLAGAAW